MSSRFSIAILNETCFFSFPGLTLFWLLVNIRLNTIIKVSIIIIIVIIIIIEHALEVKLKQMWVKVKLWCAKGIWSNKCETVW